jgi:hypothetical protein
MWWRLSYRAKDPVEPGSELRVPQGKRLVVWTQELSAHRPDFQLTRSADRPEFAKARRLEVATIPNPQPFEAWIIPQIEAAVTDFFRNFQGAP